MILYQLHCEEEHSFEAWFRDSGAYDEQAKCGHVECPYCGSTNVAKSPMAPNIASGAGVQTIEPEALPEAKIANSEVRATEVAQKIIEAVGQIREYAEENFEDVGEDFADEARKIHDGKTEERGIYGRATEEETVELEEDGVEFIRLPGTPRRDS